MRRSTSLVGAIAVFAVTALLATMPSAANHNTIFELDGNTVDSPVGAPWDWNTFFGPTGDELARPAGFVDSGFDDDYAFPDKSTYTAGSKDVLDVSGWSCTDSNNLGGKFDIVNAYATIYEVPATGAGYTAGDQLLFFGIERAATEGDGNMGFWFLQDGSVGCEKTASGKAPAFTGNHVDGDVFVVAGFSNGGTQASVTAYKWVGGAGGSLSATPFVSTQEVCGNVTPGNPSHQACGIVNTAPIPTDAGKPWPSPDKNGGDLDVNAFYEGFVRVPVETAAAGCFATFVANTRSSTSPTATIHDFSRGEFPTCRPSTTLSALPSTTSPEVVVVGDSVTYRFTETNDGNVELTNVNVTTDNADCNAAMTPSEPVTLATGASQVFSCTVPTGATPAVTNIVGTGHGTSPLGDVTWCADPSNPPANTVCDQDERATARSVSILPSTAITVTPSPTTVRQGDTVTLTITETNDGTAPAGFDPSLALAAVSVSVSGVTGCTPTYQSGDTNNDAKLDKGETWTFTCTFPAPGSNFTVTATGTGTVLSGTRARKVTFCSPTCSTGQLHDADEQASANVAVINPSTSLAVTASANITYTFRETNDSANAPLTPPTAGNRASVISLETGSTCDVSAPVYVSGDQASGAGSGILEPGETWVFTCVGSLAGPTTDAGSASKALTGIGHGTDATGRDVTYPADPEERDGVTVTITNHAQG